MKYFSWDGGQADESYTPSKVTAKGRYNLTLGEMATSHSSSLAITREWIDGNSIQRLPPSPSSPQENYVNLEFAEELYGTILDVFSKVWHSWAGRSTALNNRQVKEVLARLRLWGRDFQDGKLACVLAQSDELRDETLGLLCRIGKIIISMLFDIPRQAPEELTDYHL